MDKKRLLLVIDYQVDFVVGSLGFPKAKTIENFIAKKIEEFVASNDDVIFTLDTHNSSYLETLEGINLPIKHCLKGTEGHQLYGKIKDLANGHLMLEKDTFGSKELGLYLLSHNYDEIYLVGLVSYICVLSNAIIAKTFNANARVIVYQEGVSGASEEDEKIALSALKNVQVEIR